MTPLSDDEIRDLLTTTLHGNLPRAMMHRMFATLADVSTLRAEVERLRATRRIIGCGYCGAKLYEYVTDDPGASDHEAALSVFEEHDRTCPKNPLVAEVDRLTKVAADREAEIKSLSAHLTASVERVERLNDAAAHDDTVCMAHSHGSRVEEAICSLRYQRDDARAEVERLTRERDEWKGAGVKARREAMDAHAAALDANRKADAAHNEGVEAAAALMPTTWLHPYLTGPNALLHGSNDCRDIRRLLTKLAADQRALKREAGDA